MRRLGVMVLAAVLPVAGFAQDAVIRIEAKRGGDAAAQAAATWGAQFDDVVTFPLPRGWVAIGLGPLSPDEAEARLAALKASRQIPQDSFVALPGGSVALTPFEGEGEEAVSEAEAEEATDGAAQDDSEPETASPEEVTVQADVAPPGSYIRLQSLQSRRWLFVQTSPSLLKAASRRNAPSALRHASIGPAGSPSGSPAVCRLRM